MVRGLGWCVWGGWVCGGGVPVMQAARTDGIGPVSVEVLPKNETHRMKKGTMGTMGKSMSGGATTWMKYAYPSHVMPTPPIGTSIAPYGTSLLTRRHREFRASRVPHSLGVRGSVCFASRGLELEHEHGQEGAGELDEAACTGSRSRSQKGSKEVPVCRS